MVRKPGYLDGRISDDAVDEAFMETRRHVDAFLQNFETEVELKTKDDKDDLILTLIKCASINRAESDYDAILNIYAHIKQQDIPDKIDLMKSVCSVNEIVDVLLEIFDIEKDEVPADLILCATIVNEMFSRFYDREATPEKRNEFKSEVFSPADIGASAALILNGYIKSKKNKSRTKSVDDFKIRIRGENNPGVNVYKELSKLEKSYIKDDKSLSALLYCMPDDLSKYLTARCSIIFFGMGSRCSVKNAALGELKVKIKKIELQKEIIENLKNYSVPYICSFLKYFKANVIDHTDPNQYDVRCLDDIKLRVPHFNEEQVNRINAWLSE
jgi:hypothetical protein